MNRHAFALLSAWALLAGSAGLPVGAQTASSSSSAASAPATTTETSATRLSDLIQMARQSDAQYAIARAAAAATRERLPQARAGELPTIALTWGPRLNRERSSVVPDSLRYPSGGANLTVNQPFLRPANVLTIEQAQRQVDQAEQQLALAGQELNIRTSTAFFEVLQARDQLSAAGAQLESMRSQLQQARRAFEVGTVPVTDLNEAQAKHDVAVAQEIAASNELQAKRRILEKIIGRALPPLASLKPEIGVELIAQPEQMRLVDQAPSSALQTLAAQRALEAAEIEVRRRSASALPTLDVIASARTDRNTNYGRFGSSNSTVLSAGLELNIPIYQGGLIDSKVREAVAELDRAEHELVNARRQVLLDAQQAQLGLQSGAALTRALTQALASSETQLASVKRGLQVGVRTRVDVLNAEQQVFATRRDLAAARYRTLLAALQLRAAAGTLDEADIRRIDTLFSD